MCDIFCDSIRPAALGEEVDWNSAKLLIRTLCLAPRKVVDFYLSTPVLVRNRWIPLV